MLNTAVDHTILPNIATLDTAANAWQALKDLYDRETPNTTITLLKTVLSRKLEDGASMHDHLTNFNNDWSRLRERTSSSRDEINTITSIFPHSRSHFRAAFSTRLREGQHPGGILP